jgi:hypothetical protein
LRFATSLTAPLREGWRGRPLRRNGVDPISVAVVVVVVVVVAVRG